MKSHIWGLLVFIIACGLGCNQDDPVVRDRVAVDAVLYTGQPVRDLRLWQLAPLGQDQPVPVQAEAVVLRVADSDFFLSQQPGQTGSYFDSSGQLSVNPLQTYQLFVVHQGELIAGATEVPAPPQQFALGQDLFALNADDRKGDGVVQATWHNPQNRFYTGKILLTGAGGTKIDLDDPDNSTETVLEVTTGSTYLVPFRNLNYYGTYAFILYAVNDEYATFFGSTPATSRLQQITNVFNGLGIFTAASPDTLYFQVVPQ